jgi:hypothetical protein
MLMEYRKNGINYDALEEEWSHKLNWGYIPFSHVTAFLIKALIEFLEGKNVVLLLPYWQLTKNNFYNQYLKEIVEIKKMDYISFKKMGSS